jgi:hypothetical protein
LFENEEIIVNINYICYINKLKRQICKPKSDIVLKQFNMNFNKNINSQLNYLIDYIETIFMCKYCFSFCWDDGNKITEICNKCINIEYNDKYETCSLCDLKCKIDLYLCKLKCNHYFHLECISNIKTYDLKYTDYIKCPICNTNCLYVYVNNKKFEFDKFLYICYNNETEFDEQENKELTEKINLKDVEKMELNIIDNDKINLPKYDTYEHKLKYHVKTNTNIDNTLIFKTNL